MTGRATPSTERVFVSEGRKTRVDGKAISRQPLLLLMFLSKNSEIYIRMGTQIKEIL